MTYEERLRLYKEKKLPKEEAHKIEKDLAKYQAINDYLAEDIDAQFSQDRNDSFPSGYASKKIQHAIHRRLLAIFAAALILLFLLVRCVLDPIVSSLSYNPRKLSSGQKTTPDLFYDLNAVSEVSMPGFIFCDNLSALKHGFGKYQIQCSYMDLFHHNLNAMNIELQRNVTLRSMDGFSYPGYCTLTDFWHSEDAVDTDEQGMADLKQSSEEQAEYIRTLPSTSYLSVCVRFKKDLSLQEFLEQQADYLSFDYQWLAIRTGTVQRNLMGLNIKSARFLTTSDLLDQSKYPCFQVSDMDRCVSSNLPLLYESHFRTLLTYLSDRQDAVHALFDHAYDYTLAADYVNEHGMKAYGAILYGDRDSVLALYDSGNLLSLSINSVLASKYSW